MRIDLTEIQGGSAVLVDTAAPDQPLRVDEFQVRLSNLNSQSQEPAQLAVSMHLLNTATLSLQGPVRLLTAEPAADLAIALHTLPLPPTTPYAGPILGYALAQGTLTVDAQATLTAGSQLNINSQLLLDQIALGEAIQSPQRINAPVRLGLSLLRDSRGQIRTPLPRIYGDLNDPNFALGPVIVRTVVTLLTNVATAPFSLLASLVPGGGGGEATADLNQIRFLVGLADLDATAETVLDQLTLALKERPQLQLVVIGQAGPQDQWALRRNHLLAYLRERSQHPDALKVGSEAYRNAISRLYQRMGAPQPSDAQTLTSDAAARNTTASAGPRRPIPRTHRIGGAAQLPPTSAQEQEQATLGGALSTLFGIGGGDSTPETTSDLPPESSSDTSATNQPDTVAESTPDDATGPSDASTEVDTHEEALPFDQIEAIVLARMRMPENALENLASARADAVAAALVTRELATDRVQRRSEVLTNEPPDAGVASRVLFELQ